MAMLGYLLHLFFYNTQWKQIRGIPFIKSHNNTDMTNKNA